MATGDFATYRPKTTVRARRVLKGSEELVTTAGRVIAGQHSYVVETVETDTFTNTETVTTRVYENDEFNALFEKITDHRAELKKARDDGYSEGFDEGWQKCEDANGTAETVVNAEPETEPTTTLRPTPESDQHDEDPSPLPPVGDTLETNGPASKH